MSTTIPITRSSRLVTREATAAQTVFTFDAGPVWDTADLVVQRKISPATRFTTITTGFTLALTGTPAGKTGASCTFAVAPRPTSGDPAVQIRITSRRVHERSTDISRAGRLHTPSVEQELDEQTTTLQELRRDVDAVDTTALRVPEGEAGLTLPPLADRLSKVLGFNAFGAPIMLPTTGQLPALNSIVDSMVAIPLAAIDGIDASKFKFVQTGTGSLPRFLSSKLTEGYVSVGDYMDHDTREAGTTDDRDAIQKAVNTGRPVYFPKSLAPYRVIAGHVHCQTPSQILFGDGRFASEIRIEPEFADVVAAFGVFYVDGNGQSTEFWDLGVTWEQPDTTNRALLTEYQPGIFAQGVPGIRIYSCRFSKGWVGIDARDNAGQSYYDDLLIGCFHKNIMIDGSLDTFRIQNLHCWPIDMTANQITMFYHADTMGVEVGRCDNLIVVGGLMHVGKPFKFFTGSRANPGAAFTTILGVDFDGEAAIEMADGHCDVNGGWWSAAAPRQKVLLTGGKLNLNGINCFIRANNSIFLPWIYQTGGHLSVNNMVFDIAGQDPVLARSDGGVMQFTGGMVIHDDTSGTTNSLFSAGPSGRVYIRSMSAPKGHTHARFFFVCDSDNHHSISGNDLGAHLITGAFGVNSERVNNTLAASGLFDGTDYLGSPRIKRFVGTLDASGNITVAHGLASGNTRVIQAQGFYKGGAGEMAPLTFAYIDGSDVRFTGGTNAAKYRIALVWTPQIDPNW